MVDIIKFQHKPNLLKVAYIFRDLPYLVADKYGNFFILQHCPNKRTIPFKRLKKSKYRVYYKGTAYSLSTLRNRHIKVTETIEI